MQIIKDKKTKGNQNGSGFKMIFLALLVMVMWGSIYSFVKLGYKAFGTDTSNVAEILMFAGTRFLVCGFIITAFSLIKGERLKVVSKNALLPIMYMGIFAIVLHYSLMYIGMTMTDSSKTAIIKQIGSLIYICFSFLFIKYEKFTKTKIIGAVLGFVGIIAINSGVDGISFSFGDILIVISSFCSVASNVAGKSAMKYNAPVIVTGVSQLFGGVVLTIIALAMGAKVMHFSPYSTLVFSYICFASIVGYCLWYYIVSRSGELSKLFVIKFAEPFFACVFGAILLGEDIFKLQYLLAFVLISAGIAIGNKN
jgi:drug/metabolite transporter (DMT)-like permease